MPTRSPLLVAAACAAALACPAAAVAAPPANDNYLASTRIVNADGDVPLAYADRVDTSEAGTQSDMFNPDSEGRPLGGGPPEPTSCGAGGPSFGRTAWWDFRPPFRGGVLINATGGFDVVVAVHEWSAQTSLITRTVRCQNRTLGGEEVLLPTVRRGRNYTIQVGGAGNTGGPLDFRLEYFPDRDADGVLDASDRCPRQKGVQRAGGCPPELRAAPRIGYTKLAGAVRVNTLAADDVPRGARVEVRCRRCGSRLVRRARRNGTLSLSGFAGRTVRLGDRIEVRITRGRTGRGQFRFGAVGKYYRWPVVREGGVATLGKRLSRCLQPGSRRPSRCR